MACQITGEACSTSGRGLFGSNAALAAVQQRHFRLLPTSFYQPKRCLCKRVLATASTCTSNTGQLKQHKQRLHPRATYPEPETEKERSSVDFPQVNTVLSCRPLQDWTTGLRGSQGKVHYFEQNMPLLPRGMHDVVRYPLYPLRFFLNNHKTQ